MHSSCYGTSCQSLINVNTKPTLQLFDWRKTTIVEIAIAQPLRRSSIAAFICMRTFYCCICHVAIQQPLRGKKYLDWSHLHAPLHICESFMLRFMWQELLHTVHGACPRNRLRNHYCLLPRASCLTPQNRSRLAQALPSRPPRYLRQLL